MSALVSASIVALGLSVLARRRRRAGALALDDVALGLATHLGIVGVVAVMLALIGHLGGVELCLSCTGLALLIWPWTGAQAPVHQAARDRGSAILGASLVAVVALGVGLRAPTLPAALAGRDQGTYVLRAQLSMRTGGFGFTDPVLAAAGAELDGAASPPGALDLLGLYPTSDEAWRRDHYDAAYRPGAYLGDREAGEVVPQFFHLHPTLLAVGGLMAGSERAEIGIGLMVLWTTGLWLVCLGCVGRRLWPRGPWAALALALVACSPLAIWTGRTPLSENPMALFSWSALLAALRLRETPGAREDALALAIALGASAFVRGNALITLPVILAVAWLRPRDEAGRDRGIVAAIVAAALVASAALHATTSYPYVHDELLRRLPEPGLSPLALVGIAVAGGLAWLAIDRAFAARASIGATLLRWAPPALALAMLAALVGWWVQRSLAPAGPPFSRLDPLAIGVGAPTLVLAAVGVTLLAATWRPEPREVWLVAFAAVVPTTLALYAGRGLPAQGLFYYGRYLVPELVPAAALAAVAAIERGARVFPRSDESPRPYTRLGLGLGSLAGLGLVAWTALPLALHPQLRLRERAAAASAVTWLSARVDPGAVVIAGGEGWHSGHTHNQVGGALALGHGVTVVPYRTREDAWISAWELLVSGPARRGEEPPPVYLLVNEAAHPIARGDGARVALLDDQLWAPFVVERASLLELFVHALTPAAEQLPTRVTRHELRMGLLRLDVDARALAGIVRLRPGDPGLEIRGGLGDDGQACVSPERALELRVAPELRVGARHVVIVADSIDARGSRRVPRWSLTIAGEPAAVDAPPGLRPRARATLGPTPVPMDAPEDQALVLALRGAALAKDDRVSEACPHGRVAEVILLPRERGGVFELDADHLEATTLGPERSLGHPIEPTRWVPGRSLTRYRPGTTPTPALAGFAMILEAGASLDFAPIDLPLDAQGAVEELDVFVTLARTHTPAGARLRVSANGATIGELEVPAMRERSFISEALPWQPAHDRAALRVQLIAEAGDVELRDVALFARRPGLASAVRE